MLNSYLCDDLLALEKENKQLFLVDNNSLLTEYGLTWNNSILSKVIY